MHDIDRNVMEGEYEMEGYDDEFESEYDDEFENENEYAYEEGEYDDKEISGIV